MSQYPKVTISYCVKCKWQNRAVWYLQEIFQTFEGQINEVSLQPIVDQPGRFEISFMNSKDEHEIIYKRRFKNAELAIKYGDKDGKQEEPYYYDGFPDSKLLKKLIRDRLEGANVGHHIDQYDTMFLAQEKKEECKDCKE